MPCFYEKEDQESIVKELKKDIFDKIAAARLDNVEDLEKISEDYTVKYLLTSTILKSRSFSQENEWRLFGFKKKTNKASNVQFRKGISLIVPYLKIRLKNNAGKTPIEKIYVGPTPHKELAVESTKLLVASKKINCPVRDSDIPYRGW